MFFVRVSYLTTTGFLDVKLFVPSINILINWCLIQTVCYEIIGSPVACKRHFPVYHFIKDETLGLLDSVDELRREHRTFVVICYTFAYPH